MRIRFLTGSQAGHVQDVPDKVAEIELQFGTAELVEDDPIEAVEESNENIVEDVNSPSDDSGEFDNSSDDEELSES